MTRERYLWSVWGEKNQGNVHNWNGDKENSFNTTVALRPPLRGCLASHDLQLPEELLITAENTQLDIFISMFSASHKYCIKLFEPKIHRIHFVKKALFTSTLHLPSWKGCTECLKKEEKAWERYPSHPVFSLSPKIILLGLDKSCCGESSL